MKTFLILLIIPFLLISQHDNIEKSKSGCTNLRLMQLAWERTGDFPVKDDVFTAKNRGNLMEAEIDNPNLTTYTHGDYTYTIIDDIDSLKNEGIDDHKVSVIETFEDMEMDYKDGGVAVKVSFYNSVFEATKFAFITFKKHETACEWVGFSAAYLDFGED
jgi:hypothetical protein